jgi:DNA-binding transcriptional LysR family regulator
LEVSPFERRSYEIDLLTGEVDVVLSVGGHTPPHESLVIETLWHDELVAVQGPRGPLASLNQIDLDSVLEWPQIYTVPWPKSQNYLDIQLARKGRHRAIRVSMPSYAAAGEVLNRTPLVAMMPDRTAAALTLRHRDLIVVPIRPAILTPLFIESSKAFAETLAGAWFRDLILKTADMVVRLPHCQDA